MPTWCHMFTATLLGSTQLWFDELSSESINSFKDLRKKFLAHYLQQKRYTWDLVEMHRVKQKRRGVYGSLYGTFHKLNDNIPKMVDEMMSVTKAFIQGEKAAADQSKRRSQPWKKDFHKPRQEQNFE
ncbi:reverse transcriptase domain-containing protein [Tanacetum coccineum]